jgi:hypothetical protein
LHQKDRALLESIQNNFNGVGYINKERKDTIQYRVASVKDLSIIMDHFDKYPLYTQKQADFILFKTIVELINNKEHLTTEGLDKIVNLRASMNKGLSASLKTAFPNTLPVLRPVVYPQIQDPNWFAGFVSGEGCFLVHLFKAKTKTGFAVQLLFKITQHSRDEQLMRSLEEYLGCGNYLSYSNRDAGDFVVTKLSDTTDKVIPFFEKCSISGVKALDF